MAHVIVSNIVSIDGYVEGPGGVMDLPMDAAFDAYNRERIEAAGTVLLGATTYAGMVAYWPGVQHRPEGSPDDPMAQASSEDNRAISRRYDEVGVLVVSDRLQVAPSAPWAAHTSVVPRSRVAQALEETPGECVVFGSRTTWTSLLAAGLVDEVHLMVGPVALCGGERLFTQPTALDLVDVKTYPGSSNVLTRYTPRR